MFKYLLVNDNCLATFGARAAFSYLFLLLIFLSRHLRGKGRRIDPSTVFFSFQYGEVRGNSSTSLKRAPFILVNLPSLKVICRNLMKI